MRRHDLLSSSIFFALGFAVILYAPTYELGNFGTPGSGLMPFINGLLICFFSMVTFVQAYVKRAAPVRELWGRVRFGQLIFVVITLILYTLFLDKIGFLVSTFFLILLLIRFVDPLPWLTSLLGSGLASILSYLLFETWLKAQLPRGILGF